MVNQRFFDGKLYTRRLGFNRKSEAQNAARNIRAGGKWRVRVVKSGKAWDLYHRKILRPPRGKFDRRFAGKQFGLYTTHSRKTDAMALAKSLRKEVPGTPPAYRVRVVKSFGRWAVYRRQKKRKGFVPR